MKAKCEEIVIEQYLKGNISNEFKDYMLNYIFYLFSRSEFEPDNLFIQRELHELYSKLKNPIVYLKEKERIFNSKEEQIQQRTKLSNFCVLDFEEEE